VSKRTISLVATLIVGTVFVPAVRADVVSFEMFPLTGEVRIANTNATPFEFVFYSITSPTPALNGSPSVWKSITDHYDASGNGYIDALNNWTKFASSSTQLAEGVFSDPGGALSPFRSVSLGDVWIPDGTPATTDLTVQIVEADEQFSTVVRRLAIDGDYNQDGVVDMDDFDEWKLRYGDSGTFGSLRADGNLNGVVDAADYTVWRNNAGLALPGLALSTSASTELSMFLLGAAIVPEPSAAALLLAAAALLAPGRRRH
jgi:hypothetical protein